MDVQQVTNKTQTFPLLTVRMPATDRDSVLPSQDSTPLRAVTSWQKISGFGGLVVSMLASGTQVRGYKPD
jgi:hypothetical protein